MKLIFFEKCKQNIFYRTVIEKKNTIAPDYVPIIRKTFFLFTGIFCANTNPYNIIFYS